jgi:hypothetical protein
MLVWRLIVMQALNKNQRVDIMKNLSSILVPLYPLDLPRRI